MRPFFGRSRVIATVTVGVIFGLGILVRLIDLRDPPLDFNPSRQLRSAIIARGLYYEQLPGVEPQVVEKATRFVKKVGIYEPPILEQLVAWTYRLIGGEYLWVARVYEIAIWTLAGIALFILAREMSNTDGAIVSIGFYLFLTFGVIASRSFQPDPVMVSGIILTGLALYRWRDTGSWRWAILAGVSGGLTLLVKVVGVFFIAGMGLAVLFSSDKWKRAIIDPKLWVMALLIFLPSSIYYLGIIGERSASYFANWTLSLSQLWFSPSFYMRWLIRLSSITGLFVVFLGLSGAFISRPKDKPLLLGLWVGYGIYGFFSPYQFITHDYYHLPLVPIIALSLAPIGMLVLSRLGSQPGIWQVLFLGVMLVGIAYPLWMARSILVGQDYRHEPSYWRDIGDTLPDDGKVIALTQDFGHRLMYYGWQNVSLWPNQRQQNLSNLRGKEQAAFQSEFENRTKGMSYFLITSRSQFNAQPQLKRTLEENYPVFMEAEGYIIYDLRSEKSHWLQPDKESGGSHASSKSGMELPLVVEFLFLDAKTLHRIIF